MNCFLKVLLTALILTIGTGCSTGSAGSPPSGSNAASADNAVLPVKITLYLVPMILDPLKVPPAPDPAVNDATVAGVDANNNGVRDDVERWIAQTYQTSAKMRAAMSQMALSLQTRITLQNLTSEQAYLMGTKGMDAIHCAGIAADQAGLKRNTKEILANQLNTKPRLNTYLQYQDKLGSRLFKVPKTDTCDVDLALLPN